MGIILDKRIGNKFFIKTKNDQLQKGSTRLKSGQLESMNNWFYDLTWYNTHLTFDKNGDSVSNISVNGTYSGISLYAYTQTSSVTSVSNGVVTFSTVGSESHEWNILGVTFTESREIITSGTYNTNTNTGTVNLIDNEYPFH